MPEHEADVENMSSSRKAGRRFWPVQVILEVDIFNREVEERPCFATPNRRALLLLAGVEVDISRYEVEEEGVARVEPAPSKFSPGGVQDMLTSQQIEATLETSKEVVMPAVDRGRRPGHIEVSDMVTSCCNDVREGASTEDPVIGTAELDGVFKSKQDDLLDTTVWLGKDVIR